MSDDDATINDDDLKEISDDAFDEVVDVLDEEEVIAPIPTGDVFGEVDPDANTEEDDPEAIFGDYDDKDNF